MLLSAFSVPAVCIDRDLRLDQLYHTAWTAKDGAPGEIVAMAQTVDGYLWFATASGLYRFDGLQFDLYRPTSGPSFTYAALARLLATPDGGLWMSYMQGGMSFLKSGRLTNYSQQDGLFGAIQSIARDQDGAIWAAAGVDGLARFDGSRWKSAAADWNVSGQADYVFVDRRGTVWVSSPKKMSYLPKGEKKFKEFQTGLGEIRQLAEAADGTLWAAEIHRSVHPLNVPWLKSSAMGSEIAVGSNSIAIDDNNGLWITSVGDGIRRIPYPERLGRQKIAQFGNEAEIFTQKDGLSSDFVTTVMQDREHNIWLASSRGVDRFRQAPLIPFKLPEGRTSFTLTALDHGAIRVNSRETGFVIDIDAQKRAIQKNAHSLTRSYRDVRGIIWTTDSEGQLFRRIGDKTEVVSAPPSLISSLVEDRSVRLWASRVGYGPLRLEPDGSWTSLESLGSPTGRSLALEEVVDDAGRVWFAFRENRVAVLDGNQVTAFTSKDGVDVGDVITISADGQMIWLGGNRGLQLLRSHRLIVVRSDDGTTFDGISQLIKIRGKGLWMTASRGIIYLAEEELQAVEADSAHRVRYRLFNSLDGLTDQLQVGRARPHAIRGTDGLLWFATAQGLMWLDPARLTTNNLPPPVSITFASANGTEYDTQKTAKFPPRIQTLQLKYAALSLSIAERNHFRYRLDGQDSEWQDGGTRRETTYTNLGPGKYRFRVVASNDSGVWNETGAQWDFIIAPAFYQTWWFKSLCYAAVGGILWLLYLYRLSRATVKIQERLGARMEERERIARELHDTLLQGFQGLILRFQGVMKTLPTDAPAHQMMETVLDRADEVLLEGRQSVRDIREEGTTGTELSSALLHCGEELARDHTAAFSLWVVGEAQALGPVVFDESYRVGREALINAFQHSHASRIEVEITYTESNLSLRIKDDGQGIDETILTKGRSGHWGLSGMRERAQKIGARLDIWSNPGAGTEIELRIPGELAYPYSKPASLWERFRHLFRTTERGVKL